MPVAWSESMCPAITEDPTSPGRGLPVYQPATDAELGTWRVPCELMPSLISLVWTPMPGMVRDTGAGAARAGVGAGAGATDPDGTGTDAGAAPSATVRGWRVSTTRPTAPSASTSSPQASTARASRRRRRPAGRGPPGGGPPAGETRGGGTYRDDPGGAWPPGDGPRFACRGPPAGVADGG